LVLQLATFSKVQRTFGKFDHPTITP